MSKPIKMDVRRYFPRYHKLFQREERGAIRATYYTYMGEVDVFTFPGDAQHRAFTNLEMYLDPYVYRVTIARHYHERWLSRLANAFAEQCSRASDSRS